MGSVLEKRKSRRWEYTERRKITWKSSSFFGLWHGI